MHGALEPDSPVRNLVCLTTPIDTTGSLYGRWVAREHLDVDDVADALAVGPGRGDRLGQQADEAGHQLLDHLPPPVGRRARRRRARREAYQSMAKWVADNPPFPGRAYREWITWMYKENRLGKGTLRLRGRRVDLRDIEQNLLVVTAGADHIAPRSRTRCRWSTCRAAPTSRTSTAPAGTSA